MLRIILLLLSFSCNAQIIQSHDITAIYGESIASYSGRTTLYKIRNTALDTYDNTPHILENVLQKYSDVDNLMLIGFEGKNAIPLFDSVYAKHVESVVLRYRSANIDTFCNTLCLPIGKLHKVVTVRQARKALLEINPKHTVLVSLTSLWDEDRRRWIYLDSVTSVFTQSKNFMVSPLYFDNHSHLHFRILAKHVYARNMRVEARINLKAIMELSDAEQLLGTTEKLNIKAK